MERSTKVLAVVMGYYSGPGRSGSSWPPPPAGWVTRQDRFLHRRESAPAQSPSAWGCMETVLRPGSIVQPVRLIYLPLDKGRDRVSGSFSRDYF